MNTSEAILTRRSIRAFTQDAIPMDLLKHWVTCGMHAPSAGNEQPWHFLIITDHDQLQKIPTVHPHALMIKEASAGILICYDPALEKHTSMAVQDCAAATQNILLSIHEHGYGAVWLGVYPREQRMKGLSKLFSIPEQIVPFSLISIGKAAEQKDPVDRFDPSRIHHNGW